MKRCYFILSLIIFSCSSGQEKEDYENAVILETIVLPKIINETSGLEILDNQFITHNDSGGDPSLYMFSEAGEIIQTVEIINQSNNENFINVFYLIHQ